jgi:hypothetical protein
MKKLLLSALLAASSIAHAATPTHSVTNGTITAGMDCQSYGCAITTINWNGTEFINNYDHGRQGQIAMQLGGYGECWNPTEAGSKHDGNGAVSSSYPTASWATATTMASQVLAAYWSIDGTGACPLGTHPNASYSTPTSSTIIRKQVTAGVGSYAQALRVDVEIVAESTSRSIELFTTYSSPIFGRLYRVDSTGTLSQPLWTNLDWHTGADYMAQGTNTDVVIAATHDSTKAIAVVRPASTFRACETSRGYFGGHFAWGGSDETAPGTTKLSVSAVAPAACGTTVNYTLYVLVGTLTQVRNMVVALRN